MKIQKGMPVRYSEDWLRSIGCYTGDLPFARGIVLDVRKVGRTAQIATVEWDTPNVPTKCNVKNLSVIQ